MSRQLATGAFRRYTELLEEFIRQRDAGRITKERHDRFTEAMEKCKKGMTPQERHTVETAIQKKAVEIMKAENAESFSVDTSKPPYEVPCPTCYAFALGPCMNKKREPTDQYPGMKFPSDARVLKDPHPSRQVHWEKNPQMRVRAMK